MSTGARAPEPAGDADFGGSAAGVGSGPMWAAADAGERAVRKVSTSGWRVARTLSSSVRIWEMVFSSVRGAFSLCAGVAFDEGGLMGSPPPTRAIVLPALMP